MKRIILTGATAALMLVGTAGPALATHEHYLHHENGNCVDQGGKGLGTGQEHDHSSFHGRVHTGTPGTHAFAQENNPMSVNGTPCQ